MHVSEVYSVTPLPSRRQGSTQHDDTTTYCNTESQQKNNESTWIIKYDTPTGDMQPTVVFIHSSKVTGICSLLLAVPPADRNDWRFTGGKNRHMRRRVHFSTQSVFRAVSSNLVQCPLRCQLLLVLPTHYSAQAPLNSTHTSFLPAAGLLPVTSISSIHQRHRPPKVHACHHPLLLLLSRTALCRLMFNRPL
jgi:hypothetical protein